MSDDDIEGTVKGSRERWLRIVGALAHRVDRRSVVKLSAEAWKAIRAELPLARRNEADRD
jgi:hypothetical protein